MPARKPPTPKKPAKRKAAARRPRHAMPAFVRTALEESGLMDAYKARPPHQRNDYVGWIKRAVRQETRKKRLRQMLEELAKGDVYMGMKWSGRRGRD